MQKKWQKRVKNTPKQGIFRLFNSLPIVKTRVSPIVKMRIFQLPSPLYPPAGTSGLRLINLDDDYDDFYNNSSKKLSLVLDVLERFLKKGKSSEFNS